MADSRGGGFRPPPPPSSTGKKKWGFFLVKFMRVKGLRSRQSNLKKFSARFARIQFLHVYSRQFHFKFFRLASLAFNYNLNVLLCVLYISIFLLLLLLFSFLFFFFCFFKNLLRLRINILSSLYPEINFPAEHVMKINNLSQPKMPAPPPPLPPPPSSESYGRPLKCKRAKNEYLFTGCYIYTCLCSS